jgi:hypothetical protein
MTQSALSSHWQTVESQREKIPSMYGEVDFSVMPERFTTAPDAVTQLYPKYAHRRSDILANKERVEIVRSYSMMGDLVADAYAALMREHGFRALVDMLVLACDKGVEAVPDAPPELAAFIADMERKPAWLDMKMVEEGARLERNFGANVAPFVVRGAFIATFMNKYSALPMAITNTLSSETAAKRVKETATFFTTTILPGAMERFGAGFKAAAMVRLMHSMVRANVLRRKGDWDQKVYGIPIPQVDQMPAGLLPIFLMSAKILEKGRTEFTPSERARVEMARYRCFLLGLPEELLADTPQGIFDMMTTRHSTLRAEYDDSTCGALLRATMAADLRPDQSLWSNLKDRFERAFSKVFFVQNFMHGDRKKAAAIGVDVGWGTIAMAGGALIAIVLSVGAYALAARLPGMAWIVDRRLVRTINKQLSHYGHAHFTTDASAYRTSHAGA